MLNFEFDDNMKDNLISALKYARQANPIRSASRFMVGARGDKWNKSPRWV